MKPNMHRILTVSIIINIKESEKRLIWLYCLALFSINLAKKIEIPQLTKYLKISSTPSNFV